MTDNQEIDIQQVLMNLREVIGQQAQEIAVLKTVITSLTSLEKTDSKSTELDKK